MKKKRVRLDKYEREILKSVERGEWKPVKNMEAEIKRHAEYAREDIRKTERINIRLSKSVLEDIKIMAVEAGLPYQTYIANVLYRYATGRGVKAP